MQSENVIEIKDLYKSFKIQYDAARSIKELLIRHGGSKAVKHEVLKGVSLDIKKGETVCLIGNNGCGKSTLLKLMTKIIYPTSGTVKTYGKIASLLELGAGFHPDFTGRENIYFNAAIFGMTHKQIEDRVQQIIDFSELEEFIDEPIRTYSSGMYMRLAFSVAINVDADILLIDEILAVGDQHFQDKCFDKLKELRDNSNKTIVIVSHSLDVVKDLCSRAIWIYKGHIQLDGKPEYVIEEYLNQMAKDHRKERKKKLEQGIGKTQALICIDSPVDAEGVDTKQEDMEVRGWTLCNDETCSFELYIGSKKYDNLKWSQRADVMAVYGDKFGGLVDETKVGWMLIIPMQECIDESNEEASLKVFACVKDKEGKIIQSKEAIMYLEEQ